MNADSFCEPSGQPGPFVYPYPVWREDDDYRPPLPAEPCQMADAANFNDDDAEEEEEEDNMAAADEDLNPNPVLQHIVGMCLDRSCPNCLSEVIDKPQDDLRQCRACGELWGFDDTQTMDEFVREFGRMEMCRDCGADRLDDFQIAENHGRQELICLRCRTVQETEPRNHEEDFEFLDHRQQHPEVVIEEEENENLDLRCPICPEMTDDFFEKTFQGNELVRVVCPSCSHIILGKAPEAKLNRDFQRKDEEPRVGDRLFPNARDLHRKFSVRMFNLAQHCQQTLAGAPLPQANDAEDMNLRAEQAFPRMGEQVGLTIGTTMGNIVLKDREMAGATGTLGAIVGKAVCDAMYKSVARVRKACPQPHNRQAV